MSTPWRILWLVVLAATVPVRQHAPQLLGVRKIWDKAPHNAFTDLIYHGGNWYCVFREGQAHVSPDGQLRVLSSRDGTEWKSMALLSSPLGDLRDAKIVITPDGRLMLNGAAALPRPGPMRHQSLVWFSEDGRQWTEAHPVAEPDFWLWRVTWHEGYAYGFGYGTNPDRDLRKLRLYRSRDGRRYEVLVADLDVANSPSESVIRFRRDGSALCLLRRDPYRGEPSITDSGATAQLGVSHAPFTNWKWKDLGVRIGGPDVLELPDGRLVAGVRLHDGNVRTALCWLDPEAGSLKEFLALPSGGDTSYPGLAWQDGVLWVSYYSSHEGKSAIYLAKVRIP